MATRQAAIFYINIKISHEITIHMIGRCLKITKDEGVLFKTNSNRELDYYGDVYFACVWDKLDSGNLESVLRSTSYVLIYTNYLFMMFNRL